MAHIENLKTKDIIYLNACHLFGRSLHLCDTLLRDEDISRTHATIFWSDLDWYIRDHSRNGILVDGEFIRKAAVKLEAGTEIQFGSINSTIWKIKDIEAPFDYLRSLVTKKILVLDSYRALPDEQQPDVMFYKLDNEWVAESAQEKKSLTNGTRFGYDNEEWEFVANEILYNTIDHGITFQKTYLEFSVSPDEEDVRLKLVADDEEYDLGRRTYNYLLLVLTRKRLDDFNKGLALADQGWLSVHELEKNVSRELGHNIDEYYLNLQIFRLRKQLNEIKPFGYLFSKIIERRPGELRFAFPQLKIIKDNVCEGEIVC